MNSQQCAETSAAPGVPECDTPQVVFEELMEEIKHAINYAPRNVQTAIGPSGLGDECDRSLIYALSGRVAVETKVNFKAWVGTSIHAELERIFANSEMQNTGHSHGPRYLLEQKVTVGQINGVTLAGSCDLFDTLTGTVVDWKTKGPTTLQNHRRKGPGHLYRVQAHAYGLGMQNAGHTVKHVSNIYIPRNGEFSEIVYWAEPFNEQIALDAIARAEGLAQLIEAYGIKATLDMHPTLCTDPYCDWCPNERAKAARANPPSTKSVLGIAK